MSKTVGSRYSNSQLTEVQKIKFMNNHILLYSNDPGLGGVAQYNHALGCGLAVLGYQITYVQSQFPNRLLSEQKQIGIKHLWIEFDTLKDPERTVNDGSHAQEILEIAKPDLIIFSDTWPLANSGVKKVAIQMGIPYIVVVGYVAPFPGGLPTEYINEIFSGRSPIESINEMPQLYQQAKVVIAVSKDNLNLLHQLFALPQDKGQVIYSGRPEIYFAPIQNFIRDRLRQELDIPLDAVVCLTVARLDAVKGYQYQLAAIERLEATDIKDSLYFVWVGGGKLEKQLRDAVNQLRMPDKVKMLGQRWDILDLYGACDIFILPSLSEGMPLAIMEAMAKGLPVIASAVSGIPEELGDTGKLLPDPNIAPEATVQELVATIQTWCANPELRNSIGRECKIRAENLYREERMISEMNEVIRHALKT